MIKSNKCKYFNIQVRTCLILILIFTFSISGCSKVSPSMLEGKDAYTAIKIANEWSKKRYRVISSATPLSVNFIFQDKSRISIPMPEDKMYVAVAPYIKSTHT